MKRATVTLPDDLEELVEAYRRTQEVPPAFTAVVQAALKEFLARRGFASDRPFRPFEVTPAEEGSGVGDVSSNHDRHFAESAGA